MALIFKFSFDCVLKYAGQEDFLKRFLKTNTLNESYEIILPNRNGLFYKTMAYVAPSRCSPTVILIYPTANDAKPSQKTPEILLRVKLYSLPLMTPSQATLYHFHENNI